MRHEGKLFGSSLLHPRLQSAWLACLRFGRGARTRSRPLFLILRFLSSGGIFVQKRQQIGDGFLVKRHTPRVEISPRAWFVHEVAVPVLAADQRRTIPRRELLARLRRHVADRDADPSVV